MEHRERKTASRFSIAMRVLAGVLALIMLFSVVSLLLTRVVQPKNPTLTEKAVTDAFDALRLDDEYLNASAAARVRMLLTRIKAQPESAEEYEQLAAVYVGRGDYAEAAVLYQNSVNATDPSDAGAMANRYLKLASARVLSGEVERAEEGYQSALAYEPNSLLARLLLAQVCIELGAYQKAANHLAYYLMLVPNDADNRRLLGNLYESEQKYALANAQYREVYRATNAPEDCLSLARTAAMLGDDAAVIELFTTYLESAEDPDGSCHYLRGISFLRREDYGAAQADLEKAVSLGFADAEACYVYLTISTYLQDDFEATIAYGERAAALWKAPDGECLQRMGLSALQLGRYADAIAYLEESLAVAPALTDNHYFMANAYLLSGDFERACAAFGRSIDSGYLTQQCYYNRAICSMQLGDYTTAVDDLRSSIVAGEDADIIASARDFLAQLGVSEE